MSLPLTFCHQEPSSATFGHFSYPAGIQNGQKFSAPSHPWAVPWPDLDGVHCMHTVESGKACVQRTPARYGQGTTHILTFCALWHTHGIHHPQMKATMASTDASSMFSESLDSVSTHCECAVSATVVLISHGQ